MKSVLFTTVFAAAALAQVTRPFPSSTTDAAEYTDSASTWLEVPETYSATSTSVDSKGSTVLWPAYSAPSTTSTSEKPGKTSPAAKPTTGTDAESTWLNWAPSSTESTMKTTASHTEKWTTSAAMTSAPAKVTSAYHSSAAASKTTSSLGATYTGGAASGKEIYLGMGAMIAGVAVLL